MSYICIFTTSWASFTLFAVSLFIFLKIEDSQRTAIRGGLMCWAVTCTSPKQAMLWWCYGGYWESAGCWESSLDSPSSTFWPAHSNRYRNSHWDKSITEKTCKRKKRSGHFLFSFLCKNKKTHYMPIRSRKLNIHALVGSCINNISKLLPCPNNYSSD